MPPRDGDGAAEEATPDDANAQPLDQTPEKKPVNGDPNPIPTAEHQPNDSGHPTQPALPGLDEILPFIASRPAPTERTNLLGDADVDPMWQHYGEALVYLRALTGLPFTTDDLRADGLGEPRHVNDWGRLMGTMARAGFIRPIGAGRSTRASRAGGLRTVWVGTDTIQRGTA